MNLIETFIAQLNKSESTKSAYRYSLIRFEKWLIEQGKDIDKLTPRTVQKYVNNLENPQNEKDKPKSASSIARELAAITSFAIFSKQKPAVSGLQVIEKESILNTAPKSLNEDELDALIDEVIKDGNKRNIAMVYLLLLSGIRVSELVNLDIKDVSITSRSETSYIHIKKGKGNKERKIPFKKEARYKVKEYLDTRTDDCEALFVTEKGETKRMGVRNVQKLLSGYGIHPHLLRHTFATLNLKQGKEITLVADYLGHLDLNTTRRYTKMTFEEKALALDKVRF
ncbi:tyrosine-type recombinase/integrase [Paenibacillus filicis]|uniref:Tyrosine-type recombinase/integrase n=1 Tax=Paenibacillus gyeongsangnamensis TaxID=3388067 RepID=A0ABT4Q6C4_9BACL|nr:tyrosine-type recombinase/integrase [Paenibacillus filicis]MCZ8512419.1 tyrosine-type recombinase/integrase [Paenibacillus filicis]